MHNKNLIKGIGYLGSLSVLGILMFAGTAFAAIQGSAGPNYPDPVTVGQTGLSASLSISNTSDGANATHSVSVTGISTTPSCGTTINNPCQPADVDLGVFTVHNGTGRAATACAGIAFTAGAPDASGAVTFTPGSAVTLGPAGQCIIDFTVDVLKVPTKDDSGTPGIQTGILGKAVFQDQTTLGFGSGTGSTETTVNKASPSIATVPSAGGPIGTVLNDTATLSGGVSPTGNVTFKLFAPSDATCSAAAVYTDTDGSAPYATSPGYTSLVAGTYHWTADYAGDANNNATSSPCSAETATITKLDSNTVTVIHDGTHNPTTSVVIGTGVHDNAHVTGSGPVPTGTVVFNLYTNSACTGATTTTQGTLSGGFAESGTTTANSALGYIAYYQGDANYNPSIGQCEPLTTTKLSPTIATNLSATSVPVGTSVHDSATLTGATTDAGGTVTYTQYTNSSCSAGAQSAGTKTVTNHIVPDSDPLIFGDSGTFYWQAVYSGDAKNNAATSTCTDEILTVTKVSPTISTNLSATTVNVGTAVHDSATLTGGTADAGGTATYTVYSDNACSANPQNAGTVIVATHLVPDSNPITFNTAGTFYWQVVYSGDTKNTAATSTCQSEILTVNKVAGQYCSPGYWKQDQHFDSWVTYLPTDKFSTIFSVAAFDVGKGKKGASDPTLLEALNGNGGGLSMEARVAVDALLNSTSMNYGITTANVISIVHNAFTTNNFSAFGQFTIPENCPLN